MNNNRGLRNNLVGLQSQAPSSARDSQIAASLHHGGGHGHYHSGRGLFTNEMMGRNKSKETVCSYQTRYSTVQKHIRGLCSFSPLVATH